MRTDIIDTIRKLLRLAARASDPAEAQLADWRAQKLMEKHGITVQDCEECRLVVEGAHGVKWREEILYAVSRKHGCPLLRSHARVALTGWRRDVEAAHALYIDIVVAATVECQKSWEIYVSELRWAAERQILARGSLYGYHYDGLDAAPTPQCTEHEIHLREGLWFRAHLLVAAQGICMRLGTSLKPIKPKVTFEPPPPEACEVAEAFQRATEEKQEPPKDPLLDGSEELLALIGHDAVVRQVHDAGYAGGVTGRALNWDWKPSRALMAKSTIRRKVVKRAVKRVTRARS